MSEIDHRPRLLDEIQIHPPRCSGQPVSCLSLLIYAGWSIAEEIRSDERWSVPGLIEAMSTLPRSVPTDSQHTRLAALVK